MAIIDQSNTSKLGLARNGFRPQSNAAAWGYIDASANLDPMASKLQNTYSVNSEPTIRLKDFNKDGTSVVPADSKLDELDTRAPKLPSTVQSYKSSTGNKYTDLGPADGRY